MGAIATSVVPERLQSVPYAPLHATATRSSALDRGVTPLPILLDINPQRLPGRLLHALRLLQRPLRWWHLHVSTP